jgi:predicted glycogen debranching enzyme
MEVSAVHSDETTVSERSEWLEADGLGGFAMGTTDGVRTRRYHGVLAVATTPPTGRRMLVNALEVAIDLGCGRRALTTHRYRPDVLHPDGVTRLTCFTRELAPTHHFDLGDGVCAEQTLVALRGRPAVGLRWRLDPPVAGARLFVRPLLSMSDLHALRRETPEVAYDIACRPGRVSWTPFPGEPTVTCLADAEYHHDPVWYRDFLYTEERDRGYDDTEDLFSPGELELDLSSGEVHIVLAGDAHEEHALGAGAAQARALFDSELARRAHLGGEHDLAAEAYIVRRGDGLSIIAGYPWFTDWGRDTFLALRGLCIARGRLDEAALVLDTWAEQISEGMVPNRFVDQGDEPEFNSVDASLWFVVAVGELFAASAAVGSELPAERSTRLGAAVEAILNGYAHGTRYGVRMDADRLLAAGIPGVQLTWMDAKVDGEVVTPRCGKPVEIQALWANALHVGARFDARWRELLDEVRAAFAARFWDADSGHLFDVVDVDHVPGTVDTTLRPNQVLAIGGLPLALVDGRMAASIVDMLEQRLWTPLGLRTLPTDDPRYRGTYGGGPLARDHAYHQGTAWPWLLGPFVEAWVRVHGGDNNARAEAAARFLAPLRAHLGDAGTGHVSEVVDGDAPHRPGGCPFQAWSLGELIRLERVVLASHASATGRRAEPSSGRS